MEAAHPTKHLVSLPTALAVKAGTDTVVRNRMAAKTTLKGKITTSHNSSRDMVEDTSKDLQAASTTISPITAAGTTRPLRARAMQVLEGLEEIIMAIRADPEATTRVFLADTARDHLEAMVRDHREITDRGRRVDTDKGHQEASAKVLPVATARDLLEDTVRVRKAATVKVRQGPTVKDHQEASAVGQMTTMTMDAGSMDIIRVAIVVAEGSLALDIRDRGIS